MVHDCKQVPAISECLLCLCIQVAEHKRAVDDMLADKRARYEEARRAEEAEEEARSGCCSGSTCVPETYSGHITFASEPEAALVSTCQPFVGVLRGSSLLLIVSSRGGLHSMLTSSVKPDYARGHAAHHLLLCCTVSASQACG